MRKLFSLLTIFLSLNASAQLIADADVPVLLYYGDKIEIPVTLINKSSVEQKGILQLALMNAKTKKSVDGWMQNVFPAQHYSLSANEQAELNFPVTVPNDTSLKEIEFFITANKDTLQKGTVSFLQLHAKTNTALKITHRLYVIRNGEKFIVHPEDDLFVNDTVMVEAKVVAPAKSYPSSLMIVPGSNFTEIGYAKSFRKMNVMISTSSFIVTHAGRSSFIITGSAAKLKANATYFVSVNTVPKK